jgi:hypothetical protein
LLLNKVNKSEAMRPETLALDAPLGVAATNDAEAGATEAETGAAEAEAENEAEAGAAEAENEANGADVVNETEAAGANEALVGKGVTLADLKVEAIEVVFGLRTTLPDAAADVALLLTERRLELILFLL